MSFSVSSTVSFSKINWDNFENRPQINGDMPFCKEDAWDKANSKCCMDGYSLDSHLY